MPWCAGPGHGAVEAVFITSQTDKDLQMGSACSSFESALDRVRINCVGATNPPYMRELSAPNRAI